MKVNAHFTLDIAIVKLLQEEKNKSALVNELLSHYFSEQLLAKNPPIEKPKEDFKEDPILKEVFGNG